VLFRKHCHQFFNKIIYLLISRWYLDNFIFINYLYIANINYELHCKDIIILNYYDIIDILWYNYWKLMHMESKINFQNLIYFLPSDSTIFGKWRANRCSINETFSRNIMIAWHCTEANVDKSSNNALFNHFVYLAAQVVANNNT